MIFTLTTTKHDLPCAELRDGETLVAKLYPNASDDKLRLVLPELHSFKQTRIDIESHYIEFERQVWARTQRKTERRKPS